MESDYQKVSESSNARNSLCESTANSTEMVSRHLLPVRDALDALSGKWKLLIIVSLMQGNKRFKEIERSIPRLSSKVLAKELRTLEEDQLIERKVFDTYPVSIEYTLTEHSKSLKDVVSELYKWGTLHREKMLNKA